MAMRGPRAAGHGFKWNGETIDYPAFLEEEPVDAFVVECAHFPAERLAERLLSCKAEKVTPSCRRFPGDTRMRGGPGPADARWGKRSLSSPRPDTPPPPILKQAESTLPFPMAYPADGDSYVI